MPESDAPAVAVEQCDRDAAALLYDRTSWAGYDSRKHEHSAAAKRIKYGDSDSGPYTQAFAKARLSATHDLRTRLETAERAEGIMDRQIVDLQSRLRDEMRSYMEWIKPPSPEIIEAGCKAWGLNARYEDIEAAMARAFVAMRDAAFATADAALSPTAAAPQDQEVDDVRDA